jgi:protein-disulfide isomerase
MICKRTIARFSALICSAIFSIAAIFAIFAQGRPEILATSRIRAFTTNDLSPEIRDAYLNQRRDGLRLRESLLSQMLAEKLLDLEAKSTGSSAEEIVENVRKSSPRPTDRQINEFYKANEKQLGGMSFEESREQISEFLAAQMEQKKIGELVDRLRQKYRAVVLKDINSPTLKPADVIARIGTTPVTLAEFNAKFRVFLNDDLHYRFEDVRADLIATILGTLIEKEAEETGTDASGFIAREITDKMRDFSDGEREGLESSLKNRLFAKYGVKILLKEPPIIRQEISTDNCPSTGPASAPVTIVMFSDFECPACAAMHPTLTRVLQEYKGKVRLAVRNFPLVDRHPNAIEAAKAAAAAAEQGKFFEYTEILYRNQSQLDRDSLLSYASQLGLNIEKFRADMAAGTTLSRIQKDISDGDRYGVTSTPSIFVNGAKLHRLSAEALRRAIDRELAPKAAPASRPRRL